LTRPVVWTVTLTPTGAEALKGLDNKKTQREVAKVLRSLAKEPEARGHPLEGPLDGLFSMHAVRDRYRVLYELDPPRKRVAVHFVGRRKPGEPDDVYSHAAEVLRRLLSGRG
jgi:mRNA interferase RelE/StbE